MENVSAGGFGAVVPRLKGDWLRVGVLLALQPEGGSNWVLGVVRRVAKTTGQEARVGIETLSKAPLMAQFAVSGASRVRRRAFIVSCGEGPAPAMTRSKNTTCLSADSGANAPARISCSVADAR